MNPPLQSEIEPFDPEKLIDQLTSLVPLPVKAFTPADFEIGIEDFIGSDKKNPEFLYPNTSARDSGEKIVSLTQIANRIKGDPNISHKHRPAYLMFIDRAVSSHELIITAAQIQETGGGAKLEHSYIEQNKELYGEPDESTFLGLVAELRNSATEFDFKDESMVIRDELLSMLPSAEGAKARFKPTPETIDYYKNVLNELYGTMFRHIPNGKEYFSPEDIKQVFSDILENEFGPGSNGWTAHLTNAKVIKLETPTKRVEIPEKRINVSRSKLKGLIVHELGIHMMRSIMGEDTDMRLLKFGLAGYYDSEEGLGKVFEQAINGKFEDSGVQYYLISSMLLGVDGQKRNFRDVYEVMWRRKALEGVAKGKEMSDSLVDKSKVAAFKQVHRITQGTNRLPFLQSLAYFRGTDQMWRHLEAIKGDELSFSLLLLGKADPVNRDHRYTLLESKSA